MYTVIFFLQSARPHWELGGSTKWRCGIVTISWCLKMFKLISAYLSPATKLRHSNVFTPVCGSVHREGGGSLSRGRFCRGGLCPGRPPVRLRARNASYWNAFLFLLILHRVLLRCAKYRCFLFQKEATKYLFRDLINNSYNISLRQIDS